jgi:YHS domain-containing protein
MKKLFPLVLLFSCLVQNAQQAPVNKKDGIALNGYDLVSYQKDGPVLGSQMYQVTYGNTTYWFVNAENAETFKANPERYLPEYGGWCAYAMGLDGSLVEVDPETFKIIDGKLYLFYNALLNNTLKKWNKNEGELLKNANENWNKHKH